MSITKTGCFRAPQRFHSVTLFSHLTQAFSRIVSRSPYDHDVLEERRFRISSFEILTIVRIVATADQSKQR